MNTKQNSSNAMSAINIIPQILWIGLAFFAFQTLSGPLMAYVDKGQIEQVTVWNIQIKFAQKSLQSANDRAGAIVTPAQFAPFEERIRRLAPKIAGSKILWVDDRHPTQNLFERRAFSAIGISIDMVKDTDEALNMLQITSYDVIITDMSRPGQSDNGASCGNGASGSGCGLLKKLKMDLAERQPPTIIYAGNYDSSIGTLAYAFGITNRTDNLLQFTLDALERRGDAYVMSKQ